VTPSAAHFHHEAILYAGPGSLAAAAVPPVRDAVAQGEAVMAVLPTWSNELLRCGLGPSADGVEFMDMRAVGQNPARIIPLWREFVDRYAQAGRRTLGIGEPVWAGRGAAALIECRHHEALLNVAFADSNFRLLCPYDTTSLGASVLAAVGASHPIVSRWGNDGGAGGGAARGLRGDASGDPHRVAGAGADPGGEVTVERDVPDSAPADLFAEPLPAPPRDAREYAFDVSTLSQVRRFVDLYATQAGLDGLARRDLMLAADELATNSVRHAGGSGMLRIWTEADRVVCEVVDSGHITDPLVGRRRPGPTDAGGRGLWMANQVCDLVQIRTSPAGTTVRVHKSRT
jgi:anti-sigma regulatory factor (Ser/Thr protein kinase)